MRWENCTGEAEPRDCEKFNLHTCVVPCLRLSYSDGPNRSIVLQFVWAQVTHLLASPHILDESYSSTVTYLHTDSSDPSHAGFFLFLSRRFHMLTRYVTRSCDSTRDSTLWLSYIVPNYSSSGIRSLALSSRLVHPLFDPPIAWSLVLQCLSSKISNASFDWIRSDQEHALCA